VTFGGRDDAGDGTKRGAESEGGIRRTASWREGGGRKEGKGEKRGGEESRGGGGVVNSRVSMPRPQEGEELLVAGLFLCARPACSALLGWGPAAGGKLRRGLVQPAAHQPARTVGARESLSNTSGGRKHRELLLSMISHSSSSSGGGGTALPAFHVPAEAEGRMPSPADISPIR